MRRIGLVGGIGPASTIEYYRLLVERIRARRGDGSYPEFAVESIDMTAMLDLVAVAADDPDPLVEFLVERVERLVTTGAEVVAMASNTPHIVIDELSAAVDVDVVSIVDAAADAVAASGCSRVLLLGTAFTMDGGFYSAAAAARGVEVVVPSPADRAVVHDRYMNELVHHVVKPSTKRELLDVVDRARSELPIDGVVLGGTELPLILGANDLDGLAVFDTTSIHVDAIIDAAID